MSAGDSAVSNPLATEQSTRLLVALSWVAQRRQECEPAQIRPGLFLGSMACFDNQPRLRSLGISHILSVVQGVSPLPLSSGFHHVIIPLRDSPSEDLLSGLPLCFDTISQGLATGRAEGNEVPGSEFSEDGPRGGGGVLVHCMAGKSRSAAVVVAYLMKTEKCGFLDAFTRVTELRPQVALNMGFARQLRAYEATLTAAAGATENFDSFEDGKRIK